MTHLSGADAILQSMIQNGVDTIFGLPGGQLDHFFDAMYQSSDKVRTICSRHEQGAAYMAYGYARSTGKVGVYTVVPGPGVLNSTAALCSAYATNTPVLCLTGQIPSRSIGKGYGELHELPDQLATMKSLTKYAERINHPSQAPAIVNEAFRALKSGRPRPVSLEMPMDIMGLQSDVKLLNAFVDTPTEPDPEQIKAAAKLLGSAKSPLIIVGGGATHAAPEVQELAEMLQAPVSSFRSGRGIISDDHYLGVNYPTGHRLWAEADVVVGIGTRLQLQQQFWGVDENLKIIRIDIDPVEIDRINVPEVGIVADARRALRALIPMLEKENINRSSRKDELDALKRDYWRRIQKVQPQMSYLEVIRQELPEDGIFCDEITQVGFTSWYGFPVYKPRQLITCGYQGTLGYGYATALGVKIAHPDKPVISVAGDGGFLFTANEMATAVQYNIGLVTIVFNNNKFGNVQRQQKEWFGGRLIASDLHNPDFVKFAESFGAAAYRTNSPEGLREFIRKGLDHNGPTLIEVHVEEDMATPWEFILTPPVRG
ncbi:thiamine pyrophosphate-dependent enzyme [Luteithermobacter gelatinilyticus]|uniref:thiamine pyrophosphate-dependent enzyme n=1 Tax=Luteithermobacter gelatinilyticus TaxID=2582913 RepID=UPI001105E635|nr:thiamine pyrophosphate-dependent enzyme [Luteithermobacter gelatinilyticus]